MTTITAGATTITPDIVNGYQSSRASQHIFHAVLGRSTPDVTLRPASLRKGTLTLVFGTEAAAVAAENLHKAATLLTLADTDVTTVGMVYVVAGNITRELDPDTRKAWTLAVDFQEVAT